MNHNDSGDHLVFPSGPPAGQGLKYQVKYLQIVWHKLISCRTTWSSEDESWWLWWASDVAFATGRSRFSHIEVNICISNHCLGPESCSGIRVPQRMNPSNIVYPLTFPLMTSESQKFKLFSQIQRNNCRWFRTLCKKHSWSSEDEPRQLWWSSDLSSSATSRSVIPLLSSVSAQIILGLAQNLY